jgi:hypothetical protein
LHPLVAPLVILNILTHMDSELQLQSNAFTHLWNNYPELRGRVFTINNNSQNKVKGAINKALGVIAGVSDMVMLIPNGVIWIEWKIETGRQSKQQVQFQSLVEELGMKYYIVRTQEEFISLVLNNK